MDIETHRAPGTNLVYLRTLKCASTFYSELFLANGWIKQTTKDIDWNRDYVFSFIMDPYVRHIKGLVEDIVSLKIDQVLLDTFDEVIWSNLPWIGIHSIPITMRLIDIYERIDWIPIDGEHPKHEDITDALLKKYEIELDWGIDVPRNESDEYKHALFKKLLELSKFKHDKFNLYFKDQELYKQALAKYQVKTYD